MFFTAVQIISELRGEKVSHVTNTSLLSHSVWIRQHKKIIVGFRGLAVKMIEWGSMVDLACDKSDWWKYGMEVRKHVCCDFCMPSVAMFNLNFVSHVHLICT